MKHGYDIKATTPDACHQNAPAKQPHETIEDTIRSMLEGSGLPKQFWSHALYHYGKIHSYLPHCSRDKTPHEIVTGKCPNMSKLKTFGGRVYVIPPGKCQHKLSNNVNKATNACFDEGMNDLEKLMPNVSQLRNTLGKQLESDIQETTPSD
eukprot:15327059-Ditylum_brightwellii.AAC.1